MLQAIALLLAFLVIGTAFWSCKGTKTATVAKTMPVSQVVTPEWAKNAVIYEVNTRQFTPEGTFRALSAHLPRLRELGVDILWFMPIHPIGVEKRKGSLGSYYSVKDYKGVNPEFGTFDDFRSLVSEAHALGFKVILDWVANHTSHDHPWTVEHPEWYNRDDKGEIVSPFDWTDVADLNYDDNPALWDAMIDALKFWVAEANIDGYRCDVAGMVPTAFWEKARKELDAIKPVFMLAEDEGQRDLMVNAFDANYAWEFHHIMNKIAKGEKNAEDVWAYFSKEDTLFVPSSYRMMFTSNHDENSWNGTEFERMGEGARTFAVMTYTIPGFPLIYNGQEAGLSHRLLFFEKDLIDWSKGAEFAQFYTSLNRIKKENPALWNADNGGSFEKVNTGREKEVLAFVRQKDENRLLVLLNLTGTEQIISLSEQTLTGIYTDLLSGEQRKIAAGQELVLPAWGYWVMK